jgi:hypothetical protein
MHIGYFRKETGFKIIICHLINPDPDYTRASLTFLNTPFIYFYRAETNRASIISMIAVTITALICFSFSFCRFKFQGFEWNKTSLNLAAEGEYAARTLPNINPSPPSININNESVIANVSSPQESKKIIKASIKMIITE